MTTIKFPVSPEEFHAGIASLNPETRRQFVADLAASDPAWAPHLEGIDLEAPGRGMVYTCGTCGFKTQPHERPARVREGVRRARLHRSALAERILLLKSAPDIVAGGLARHWCSDGRVSQPPI